jgi:hypothetical protein
MSGEHPVHGIAFRALVRGLRRYEEKRRLAADTPECRCRSETTLPATGECQDSCRLNCVTTPLIDEAAVLAAKEILPENMAED